MTNAELKEARKRLGLTQKQMAKIFGTSQHRISELERGYDGRSVTRQMQHHLLAVEVIYQFGEWQLLFERLKELE